MISIRQATSASLRRMGGVSMVRSAMASTRSMTTRVNVVLPLVNRQTRFSAPYFTRKHYSVLSSSPDATIYNYDGVKEIASNPSRFPDTVLVDVREPYEFSEGHIPGSINVPFKSSPGALDLPADEFQDNFGFEKPETSKELVFYCLGGVRSTAAAELAETFGYKKRGNYVGSWEDWVQHENKA